MPLALAHTAGYPWLKPTDVVKVLARWNRLDAILPEEDMPTSLAALRTYWSRFRLLYPDHEIFQVLSACELETAVPIKLHGDEGRRCSAAITPFVVLQTQGILNVQNLYF